MSQVNDGALPSERAERQHAQAGPIARWAMVLLLGALVIRTLAGENTRPRFFSYVGLIAAYLVLFALVRWRTRSSSVLLHGYLAAQSALVLMILSLRPQMDSVTAFFVPLAFQAALFFRDRTLWAWIGVMLVLITGPLAATLGLAEGLARAMSPAAFVIALPALLLAVRETEMARERSEVLLEELRETQQALQAYSDQIEELAALEERERLARELHDRVSQLMFGAILEARSALLLLEQNPPLVREQLERLSEMSSSALGQLRSLITRMRM